MMNAPFSRRKFFPMASAGVGATLGMGALAGSAGASAKADAKADSVVVGIMGMGGRGNELAKSFSQQTGVSIAYVCEPDAERLGKAVDSVGKLTGKAPQGVADYRRILDAQDVDVLVVATCNHWHAPAAIAGCQAGKHVYVEKPCSHNPREGEWLVAAAKKADKRVQMGNQRRTWPGIQEAMTRLREGVLGKVTLAQAFYTANRPSIGKGKRIDPPKALDYELWQGPAPRRPFQDNQLHYNWHWFWHWGNGELGNNGIHSLDLCRWGMGVDLPVRVVSSGGRYRFDDDQETPDTHHVAYEYADGRQIVWQGLSCDQFPNGTRANAEVLFYGEKGSLAIVGNGYQIYDPKGKPLPKDKGAGTGSGGQETHIGNFLGAVRGDAKLNSPITEGHTSTLLCHLGNISQRLKRSITCDPQNHGVILNDPEAMTFWGRDYAPGFEPKV